MRGKCYYLCHFGGNYAVNLDMDPSNVLFAFLIVLFLFSANVIKELIYNLLEIGPEAIAKFSFWLPTPLEEERCQYIMTFFLI